ncbi:3-phosphoshikimate 1-carboxyvinyltransferase [Alterisphingorhabdus coralli]|uniref:3-phosphoshikimate 1-carboxyvinyltransferase n=1 Tax=Alterisphingorhabdus coralli TaxID=3071408 RepID=A0AA97I1P3_9SPHN|nr:3-phosphoshikimate 1-carboxyvinyltransferase [Parasphingorhabdus sp. SCSIO 66989]WOE74960.1 3-phosphoshikimate 1-carboxyvinyltransferase [Parasphingorhabdus sp. SCSIO 66989]
MSHSSEAPSPWHFAPGKPLTGSLTVPGDKSISHRSLILSALAVGESRISGLLEGEDVLATAGALRAMGATIDRSADGEWQVQGVGVGSLLQPEAALDMGNSGTSARLLMGLVASHPITVNFIGDASLSRRPMARVTEPLGRMGAEFTTSPSDTLPLMVQGICPAIPICYRLPVASAQVKSAIMLAALNTPGVTEIIEPVPTRDHSETMLKGAGANVRVETDDDGTRHIFVTGEANLQPQTITVPGDPSSAAFFIVAALIVPGSDLTIRNVGINPTRAGLITALRDMGGDITELDRRSVGGEPVADLHVRASALTGIDVDPALVPSMIDEFPIFFIASAMAKGTTRTSGLEELRVKESDRLAEMARGLKALGVALEEQPDGLVIQGRDGEPFAPDDAVTIEQVLDHRIAMSFAIAGLVAKTGITIADISPVATSFPDFTKLLQRATGGQEAISGVRA